MMKALFFSLALALATLVQAQKTTIGGIAFETGAKAATLKLTSTNNAKKISSGRIDFFYLLDKNDNITITEAQYSAANKVEYVYVYKAHISDLDESECSTSDNQNMGSYSTDKFFEVVVNAKTEKSYKSFTYEVDAEGKLTDPTESTDMQRAFIFNSKKKADEWAKLLNSKLLK